MKDIAILLATYNGEKYLWQQLNSLFSQTMQNFRLVIHDDGSTDNTAEIINEYREKYPDRVEVFYGHSCGGPKENFLWMLGRVEADYYLFCDQDDVWLPNKMKKTYDAIRELEKHSYDLAPLACFCDMFVTDSSLNVIHKSFIKSIGRSITHTKYSQILIDNPAAGCCLCINRFCRDKALTISNRKNVEMHDVWCLMVAAVFGRVCTVDEPLSLYRQHDKNEMGAVHENLGEKITRNSCDALSGNLSSEKEKFRRQKFLLAQEILKLGDVPGEIRECLESFIHPEDQSRIARILFLWKNDFNRRDHSIWLWFWL